MKKPICLSPLKFYDDIAKQNHRKPYAYWHISPLVTYTGVIPAFQFVLQDSDTQAISIYIHSAKTDFKSENLIELFTKKGLLIESVLNFNVLKYCNSNAVFIFPEGYYYLEINFSNNTYYSEVFCFTNSLDDFLKIEYRNDSNNLHIHNGIISFADNFVFTLYLRYQKEVLFSFEEQATERLGYQYIESQVSKKMYGFVTIIPEYLCDAMRIIRLCDNKKIWFEGEEYELISFEMEVNWQTQGDLAAAICRFESDQVITSKNVKKLAEYNLDFNLDFTS